MSADLLSPVWAGTGPMPLRSPREWETLIGQARRASLLSRLAQHHVDQGWMAAVPEGPRLQLLGALKLADRQRHEVRWEVDELARALVPLGQPVVLLKGAAYLMAGLPASRGRVFADVINLTLAQKAVKAGADGLACVSANHTCVAISAMASGTLCPSCALD